MTRYITGFSTRPSYCCLLADIVALLLVTAPAVADSEFSARTTDSEINVIESLAANNQFNNIDEFLNQQ